MSTSALFPWKDGLPPHVPCMPGEVPATVLLPGDPARVDRVLRQLDDARILGQRREFRMGKGFWRGIEIAVCSTGIGGPSTEIAVVELANLGATRLIRIGGMGALDERLAPGSFLIVDQALRGSGAARLYATDEGPLPATPRVARALAQSAKGLGLAAHLGPVATSDSYYLGQGRPTRADGPVLPIVEQLRMQGAMGVEMEAETVFAVGSAMGVEVAAVLAVHGNRITDAWLDDYEPAQDSLIRLTLGAIAALDKPEGDAS